MIAKLKFCYHRRSIQIRSPVCYIMYGKYNVPMYSRQKWGQEHGPIYMKKRLVEITSYLPLGIFKEEMQLLGFMPLYAFYDPQICGSDE